MSPGATVSSKAPSLRCTSSFSAPGWYVHTKLPPPPLGPGVPPDHLLRPMCVSTGPGEGQEVGMRPLDRGSQGPRAQFGSGYTSWPWRPLFLWKGYGWHLESMGSRMGPLLPCSKASVDTGTSCCRNLGSKSNVKCFLFIQVTVDGCFRGYSAFFSPQLSSYTYGCSIKHSW